MATVSDPEGDPPDGVEFIHENDGRVTARHVKSGVASFGDTEAEALRQLADALIVPLQCRASLWFQTDPYGVEANWFSI